ncbi:MAG: aldehyde dehydrogenase family protein [Chloroflexi bacterium]|nr:aldehyde dehydrogenase family protein [Chloroflexota bacterium]
MGGANPRHGARRPSSPTAPNWGEFIFGQHGREGHDPSRPETIAYQYALARPEHIEAALSAAVEAQASWASTPIAERKKLLVACAEALARRRGSWWARPFWTAAKPSPKRTPR